MSHLTPSEGRVGSNSRTGGTCKHACMYVCMCMHVRMYACMHVYLYACCIYIYIHVTVHVYVYDCLCIPTTTSPRFLLNTKYGLWLLGGPIVLRDLKPLVLANLSFCRIRTKEE